jgi:hypothetical protein
MSVALRSVLILAPRAPLNLTQYDKFLEKTEYYSTLPPINRPPIDLPFFSRMKVSSSSIDHDDGRFCSR